MHHMADVEHKVAKLLAKQVWRVRQHSVNDRIRPQANRDFYDFAEIVEDYLAYIIVIRVRVVVARRRVSHCAQDCFVTRVIHFKNWKSAEENLKKKQGNEARFKGAAATHCAAASPAQRPASRTSCPRLPRRSRTYVLTSATPRQMRAG